VEAAEELEKEGVHAAVVNSRFIKPLDRELICEVARQTNRLITVEENVLQGGFGSSVLELLNEEGLISIEVVRLGIGDQFVEHASQQEQRSCCSIDAPAIVRAARTMVAGDGPEQTPS
jgi:1-deoxy-D-xylulose-5-phosphate synthase